MVDAVSSRPPKPDVIRTEAVRIGGAAQWAYGALVALPCLWALVYFFPPMNHDVAALLQYAGRMLKGERLYVDLIDMNPPMIFWLSTIPHWVADRFDMAAPRFHIGFVLLIAAGSMLLARRAFVRTVAAEDRLTRLLLPVLALFAALVYPMHSFSQREHLMFVLTLPYVVSAALRAANLGNGGRPELGLDGLGRSHHIAAAAIAAIGICLKPHFLFVPVAVELYLLVQRGWRQTFTDIAPYVILGVCLGYVGATLVFCPEYLNFIVPLTLEYYGGSDSGSVAGVMTGDQAPAILLALVPLIAISFALRRAHLPRVLAMFVIGASLSGIIQAKGWDYHFFAARAGLIVLAGAVVATLIDRYASFPRRDSALPLVGLAAALMAGVFFLSGVLSPPFKGQRAFEASPAGRLLPLFQQEAAGKPVLWLTTSIYPQFPVLNYIRSPLAMHFMSLWLLPSIYADAPVVSNKLVYHSPDEMSAAEKLVYNSIADDLVRFKPALVVVTRAADERGFNGRQFDYLEYFGRNPKFAEAFKDYQLISQIDGWTIYRRR